MRLQDALKESAGAVTPPAPAGADSLKTVENTGTFPPGARAIISPAEPPVTMSRRAHAPGWVLRFERREPFALDPLMGWAGSGDTLSQLHLRFPTREAALAYAGRQGLACEVVGMPQYMPGARRRAEAPVMRDAA